MGRKDTAEFRKQDAATQKCLVKKLVSEISGAEILKIHQKFLGKTQSKLGTFESAVREQVFDFSWHNVLFDKKKCR